MESILKSKEKREDLSPRMLLLKVGYMDLLIVLELLVPVSDNGGTHFAKKDLNGR